MTGPASRPETLRSDRSSPFWDGLDRHELMLQFCLSCNVYVHYPRRRCPACWGRRLQWRLSPGRGRVASFSRIWRPGHPAWEADVPYYVALVALDEGPRLMTNLVGYEHEEPSVGERVVATYLNRDGQALLLFRALSEAERRELELGTAHAPSPTCTGRQP
jgi:uncharacterized OB-fold protein